MIEYETANAKREDHARRITEIRRRVVKFVLIAGSLALAAIVCVTAFAAVMEWQNWRTDHVVRVWMDGPRTDPVVSLQFAEIKLTDAPSLAFLNAALPIATDRSDSHKAGYSFQLHLEFESGKSIDTVADALDDYLTICTPGGDIYGTPDYLVVRFPKGAPGQLSDMLQAAPKAAQRARGR